jgi:hypothetical protein
MRTINQPDQVEQKWNMAAKTGLQPVESFAFSELSEKRVSKS